jgi:hypothetical protein
MGIALEEVGDIARSWSELGASGCFTAEGPADVFFPLVAAGMGSDLALMTNAAIGFPRNPIHLAHAAFDLQRLSKGNFRLGLAPQVKTHIERRFGLAWSSPVERMQGLVEAVRAIAETWKTGAPLNVDGPFYRHSLMTPMFTPAAMEFPAPPILVGAQGPKMAEMVGQVADGLLVLPFHSQHYLESVTLEALARGRSIGADHRSFEVVCGAIVGVGTDEQSLQVARDGVRGLLGFYGSTPAYAPVLEAEGLGALHGELRAAVRRGDWAALVSMVPQELVDAVATVGTPVEVARRLTVRFGGIADRLALFIPHQVNPATLGLLLGELRNLDTKGTPS